MMSPQKVRVNDGMAVHCAINGNEVCNKVNKDNVRMQGYYAPEKVCANHVMALCSTNNEN